MKNRNRYYKNIKKIIMPNTIAEYYTDELLDWNHSIIFYINEIDEFGQKLADVIRRNSIVGIARKVEAHQTLFNRLSEKFHKLQVAIQQQENALKTDSTFLDNTMISNEIEKRQVELRHQMQSAEKTYIDIKFDCYNFLLGTLKK
jgi:hypothetical protein